jgi:molybdopterin molybdotransferase
LPEFLRLLPPQEALNRLMAHLHPKPQSEWIEMSQALGRVTAFPVPAPHALPSFTRSTVDGYAVQAASTFGASESLPAYLEVAGEVPMGASPTLALKKTTCALIHTGGMLPENADAVLMLENTQPISGHEIEVTRAVAVGENVIQAGEDVHAGQEVIPAGTILRSVEIGGLAALGITQVSVVKKPRVGILSTGDEIIPIERDLEAGKVRDVNTYILGALVQRAGGVPLAYGILPDQPGVLAQSAAQALEDCDLVVITAGSSASTRDLTAQVISGLGEPGVFVHGVNVRPGKPTILGACARPGKSPKAVIGLPGNPVSAFVIAGLFVIPVIRALLGAEPTAIKPSIKAQLALNLPSDAGREDWVPVKLSAGQASWLAEPIFGKSNLIFTLVRADGMIRIPPDATGLHMGDMVEVFLIE